MADHTQTSDEATTDPATSEASTRDYPIVRDFGFVRLAPDMIHVIDRRQDIELSLVVQGPDAKTQVCTVQEDGTTHPQRMKLEVTFAEVARVRLVQPLALGVAMEIIQRQLAAGLLNIPAFRRAVDALFDEYTAEQPTGGEMSASTAEPA